MKRFFAITLAAILVAAVAAPSMATESRLQAMGGVGKYVEDDANIFDWPATLPSYANLFIVDLHEEYGMYGLTKSIGEYGDYGTFGIFFNEDMDGPNDYYMDVDLDWANSSAFNTWLDTKWMLVYGYEIDENMSIGLKFIRASENREMEMDTLTLEDKRSYTTIGASFRMEATEDMYFDIGFDYTMASRTDNMVGYFPDGAMEDPCGEISEDPGYDMNFRGRVFYNWTDMITLVPYVGFRMSEFDYAYEDEECAGWDDYDMYGMKGMQFNLGIAANMRVNEDNLIVFAIEPFKYTKMEPVRYYEDPEDAENDFDGEFSGYERTMPGFILGLESDVRDWLTIRTGCTKMLTTMGGEYTEGDETGEATWDDADFDWYLGAGFHVGDFTIDCMIDRDVPFQMGYWLTGMNGYREGSDQPIYRISTIYAF